MVLQHSLVGKCILWQCRHFPTELCCNIIIDLLFHYFLSNLCFILFFLLYYTHVTVLLG